MTELRRASGIRAGRRGADRRGARGNGPFRSVGDLVRVAGFGPSRSAGWGTACVRGDGANGNCVAREARGMRASTPPRRPGRNRRYAALRRAPEAPRTFPTPAQCRRGATAKGRARASARLARLHLLVRAAHLREPVDLALDHAQVAARDQLEQLLQRLGDHPGAAEAVHQPEADHGLAAGHQGAALDRVGLARRHPVDDEPAERRERAQRLIEDVAARHLQHDVDLGAVVGLAQAAASSGSRASTAASAPSPARARASPRSRRSRSRGPRRSAWRAGRRASRPRRPRRGPPRSRPARASRTCAAGARPRGPG